MRSTPPRGNLDSVGDGPGCSSGDTRGGDRCTIWRKLTELVSHKRAPSARAAARAHRAVVAQCPLRDSPCAEHRLAYSCEVSMKAYLEEVGSGPFANYVVRDLIPPKDEIDLLFL